MEQEKLIDIYKSKIRGLETEVLNSKDELMRDFTYNLPLYGEDIFVKSILIQLYSRCINDVGSIEGFKSELEDYLYAESHVRFGSTNLLRNTTNQLTYRAYLKCYNELKRLTES